jgi:hypothetical protein
MAANAYISAKDAKAPSLAPNLFRKAETLYLRAKSAYKRKYFNKAKEFALKSKQFSEKAEFEAVRKATLEGLSGDF